jgi:homoserine O-acetyltransferase
MSNRNYQYETLVQNREKQVKAGIVRSENNTFLVKSELNLERGGRLKSPAIAYRVWGTPFPDGSNVVWVCHALTGSADVMDWWKGLFGKSTLFDPDSACIICANMLGSCYGSEGPLSVNPETGIPYYDSFPEITIRDMVKAHRLLADHLGIGKIALLIGGSMGGQQALEWAVQEPDRFNRVILMATNAVHSPWGVAFNETQRMAIEADQTFGLPDSQAGLAGMKAARAAALLSYRHYETYSRKQNATRQDFLPAASYQRYQGEKLAIRFNAYSYHLLSRAMDSHDIGRDRGGVEAALASIKAQVLCISIESDILFPPVEQLRIAEGIPNSHWVQIASLYGHDGFLIETAQLTDIIEPFLPEPLKYQSLKSLVL